MQADIGARNGPGGGMAQSALLAAALGAAVAGAPAGCAVRSDSDPQAARTSARSGEAEAAGRRTARALDSIPAAHWKFVETGPLLLEVLAQTSIDELM